MSLLRRAAALTLDAAFPATCPGCGREGAPICADFRPALDARLEQPAGVPIGMTADIPAPLLQLEWCAPFTGVVRDALHALKYRGERRLAGPLGQAVARRWSRAGAGGDLLVSVPVHATRARQRGYDQAALIAEVASAELGLPYAPCWNAVARPSPSSTWIVTSARRTWPGRSDSWIGAVVVAASSTVAGSSSSTMS